MEINQILDKIYCLKKDSKEKLLAYIYEEKYTKNHILFKADKIEKKLYFLKKGVVRAFSELPDNEITFWFGKEGDPILSMRNYIENQISYETIELLENCELFVIEISQLKKLFLSDIEIANWGRKLAEKELIKTEQRLISRQVRTATQRYQEFIKEYPDLIQRIPLGYIASYIGISQVSLSRIRAKIKLYFLTFVKYIYNTNSKLCKKVKYELDIINYCGFI